MDRDRAVADASVRKAEVPRLAALPVDEDLTDERRTKSLEVASAEAAILRLTSPAMSRPTGFEPVSPP
jgi:hypothetical protein